MNFRYFILKGESLKAYLDSEAKEMEQREAQRKALLEDRDDIESFRPGHSGGILSIKFKDGKQPEGFIRADRRLPKNEVRPHSRKPESKEWRKLLADLRVTEDSQKLAIKAMGLPSFVTGTSSRSPSGIAMYNSRFGHVGEQVIVEVPAETKEEFKPGVDLAEIRPWEFEKLVEESEEYEYKNPCYTMTSRMVTA